MSASKCEYCGTTIIQDCPICGAPNCCPKCCEETTKELFESRKTTVISLHRKRGQPRPCYDFLIDRTTLYGNPFLIGRDGDREQVIAKYKEYFYRRLTDPIFRSKVLELKGKVLGCWCKPLTCHGDVIVEYLNTQNA